MGATGGYNPVAEDVEGPGDDDREMEPGIDEQQLVSVVQRELDSGLGWTGTRLAESRRQTLNMYMGNTRGDEREGRSSVVSREVFETVEWAMPQMAEVFTSSATVCEAIPVAPDDEEGAKQATDACNWVFRHQRGTQVLLEAIKDSFISKNGIIKVQWDDSRTTEIETYNGKSIDEFEQLGQDDNFEVRAVTVKVDGEEVDPNILEKIPPEMEQAVRFDIKGVRTNGTGHVELECIPPEEFIINRDARGLHDPTCRFVGHRVRSTESDLVALGYDVDLVHSLPGSQSTYTTDQDWIIRASQDDGQPLVNSYRSDSERTIHVNDCYVRIDMDGDGISEWWNVVVAGEYGQVLLSADPVAGHPYASGTPIPIPHRFFGFSLADVVMDLQHINTTLWRQYLDARYLDNDPRYVVLSQGGPGEAATPMVNLNQLAYGVPGSYIEEYSPGALRPLDRSDNSDTLIPAMELNDKRVANRTGVSADAQGINPGSISKHVFGAMMQSTAQQQRIMLYARTLADTLVKDVFQLILRELCMHQTDKMMLKLRGDWVPMDPSTWNHEMDFEISVGLGHGSKMEKINNLQTMAMAQEKAITGGYQNLVGQEQVYNTLSTLAEALGFKDTQRFVLSPASEESQKISEAQGEIPDPVEQALELEQRAKLMELALRDKKIEYDHEENMLKLRLSDAENEARFGVEEHKVVIEDKNMQDQNLQNMGGAAL